VRQHLGAAAGRSKRQQGQQKQVHLEVVYFDHVGMAGSGLPPWVTHGVKVGEALKELWSAEDIFQEGDLVGPRVSGVVDETITGGETAGILVDKFVVGYGEEGVVEEKAVHGGGDFVLKAKGEIADVVQMKRFGVNDGGSAGHVHGVEHDKLFGSRSEGGESSLEKVERGHHRLVFLLEVHLYRLERA
jgi:hypothetical protein